MRLWAYGDSHTAGAELGYSERSLSQFQPGGIYFGKDWNQHLINRGEYTQLISGAIACAPENSWTGQLAELLGADLICKAIPGWSNDGAVKDMLRDMSHWAEDDIIFWGVATPWRFTPAGENLLKDNHQVSRMPTKAKRVLVEYGPHETSLTLWTQALMHLAKSLHKNMKMVYMSTPDLIINDYDVVNDLCVIDISLGQFKKNNGDKYKTLPQSHYDRPCHRDYAEMIYNTLGDKNG